MNNNKLEILAPAGGKESLLAALRCGADAVYLGARSFSARSGAENFNQEELSEAAKECRLRGVKLYLALNTMVFDSELDGIRELIKQGAVCAVDAMIVQDLGVASLVREICPDMPLHGSTQMSVHTPAGALFLQRMGFKRVILARELSKNELREIIEACQIETEVFVHGALCMSVSGQCTMSAVAGRRSGNRGQCAQPCRLPFSPNKGENRYCLSLRDLSLTEEIAELAELCVTSVKIEGRLKRPEYVAAAVSACVSARNGTLQPAELDRLRAVFSRAGFTKGYYENRRGAEMFGVRGKEDVTAASGVLKELARLYDREPQRVPVTFYYTQREGVPLTLEAEDDRGNRVKAVGAVPERALNAPTDRERAVAALAKLGGTPFRLQDTVTDMDETLIAGASQLNALRRECVELLTARRFTLSPKPAGEGTIPAAPHIAPPSPALRARLRRYEQLPHDMADAFAFISLPLDELWTHRDALAPLRDKLIAEPPRAMFGQERETERLLLDLREWGVTRLYAGNLAHLELGRRLGMAVHGGYSLNIANSAALDLLEREGVRDTELSFEPALDRILKLRGGLERGIIGYGRLPVMLTRCCPLQISGKHCAVCKKKGGIMFDRLGNRFWVVCAGEASEVFNCRILYLADRLPELRGLDFITLMFLDETADEVRSITREYQAGGTPPEDFTRGLYYRGVL